MLAQLLIFAISLYLLVKGATLSTKYASRLAEGFGLPKYTVGFIVVAIISILPETFISINAALQGMPSFGLATLFGSNIADLTLIFALLVAVAGHDLKIESKILKRNVVYPFILLLPIILGFDGFYSRAEGLVLITVGIIFYYLSFQRSGNNKKETLANFELIRLALILLFGLILLLAGSYFTVYSASALAHSLNINPILIGILIVGLGTTMPELFFSLQSVRKHYDSLAIGDILGTVLADATIVVGILAVVSPFAFPQKIVFITGIFMVVSSLLLFYFLRTGRALSGKEAFFLFFFWAFSVLMEVILNTKF